jgi:hypothetical protein
MFLRALFAFLALPTVVGGIVPWLLLLADHWRLDGTMLGWLVLACGVHSAVVCPRLLCDRQGHARPLGPAEGIGGGRTLSVSPKPDVPWRAWMRGRVDSPHWFTNPRIVYGSAADRFPPARCVL